MINNMIISVFAHDDMFHVDYSQRMDERQEIIINQKVIAVAKQIYASISDRSAIKKIDFIFNDGEKALKVMIERESAHTEYDMTQLGRESAVRSQDLVRIVHKLGKSILEQTSAAASSSSLRQVTVEHGESAKQASTLSKIIRSLQRWFSSALTLDPQIQEFAKRYFHSAHDEKGLKEKWRDVTEASHKMVEKLYGNLNEGRSCELFSKEEISQKVAAQLEREFCSQLHSTTEKILTKQERQALRNEKKVQEAVARFQDIFNAQEERRLAGYRTEEEIVKDICQAEKMIDQDEALIQEIQEELSESFVLTQKAKLTSELKEWEEDLESLRELLKAYREELEESRALESGDGEELKQALAHLLQVTKEIPASEFPLESLAYLPVNVHTEEVLVSIWDRLLRELVAEGDLNHLSANADPSAIAKQVCDADAYLLARQLLPQALRESFQEAHALDTWKIEQFIRSQPNAPALRSLPQSDLEQRQRRIYHDLIRPFVDAMREKILNEHADFASVANFLMDRESPFLADWATQVETKLDVHHILAEERKELKLTRDKVIDLLIANLEELGREEYYLQGEQIDHLRMAREAVLAKGERLKNMKEKITLLGTQEEEFSKKIQSLQKEMARHAKQKASSTIEIPELDVSLLDLDRKEFEEFAKRQSAELESVREKIKQIRAKGKKAIIDPKLMTRQNDLISQQKILDQALKNWDKRSQILPSSFMATVAKAEISVLELSEKQIQLIKVNLESVDKKIAETEKNLLAFGKTSALQKELQFLKGKKSSLLSTLAAPAKFINHQQMVDKLAEQKQQVISEFAQSAREQFNDLSPLDLSLDLLGEIKVTEDNHAVMGPIWTSVLQNLHAIALKDQDSSVRALALLQYREARRLLSEIAAPDDFKHQVAAQIEELEKPADQTQALIEKFKIWSEEEGRDLSERLAADIQKLKAGEMRFEALASLDMDASNAEAILALWKQLLEDSVSPLERNLEALQSDTFAQRVSSEELRQLEEATLHYGGILTALKKVSNPLVDKDVKQLIADFEKRIPAHVHQVILRATKERASLERAKHDLTGTEVLIGEVKAAILPEAYSKVEPAKRLTSYEIEGLQVLAKAMASADFRQTVQLSEKEQQQLQAFIRYAREPSPESRAFNAKLREMVDGRRLEVKEAIKQTVFGIVVEDDRFFKKVPFGISNEAIHVSLGLSYQFRNIHEFAPLTAKLENLLSKVEKEETIRPKERLTNRELGLLYKCQKIGRDSEKEKSLLTRLEELGADKQDATLSQVYQMSKKAQELIAKLEEKFQEQAHYRDGDFVANLGYRKHEFYGHKTTLEENLHFKLITPYSHGAKIYIEEGKKKLSHVLGGYVQSDYSFSEDSYSEVWRLDVAAMMPLEQRTTLAKVYGADWPAILQKKYEAIENHIQKNEKNQFDDLENPWERRMRAGKADYIWGGHTKNKENDFNKMADRILGDKAAEQDHLTIMICSEFVTKTTLAALVILNRNLSEEMGNYLVNQGRVQEGEKLKREKNVFDLPVGKKEKLKNVHPGRMIDLFKSRKCIKRVDPPAIIQQIVNLEKGAL